MNNQFETWVTNLQQGRLSRNSMFRLSVNLIRADIEKNLATELQSNQVLQTLCNTEGFHLHYTQPPSQLLPNQVYLYIDTDNILNAKFLQGDIPVKIKIFPTNINGAWNGLMVTLQGSDTQFTTKFTKIHDKIKNGIPLSSMEAKAVFEKLGLQQKPHPLLKAMDEYIFSMKKQRAAKHINDDMARDKIQFTETLRTFAENPVEENWMKVREAMQLNPRYAFSWTGTSQVDLFLSFIKIQYQDAIQGWDDNYQKAHTKEAKTSWGHFIYNFGWIYYIPSFFLAPIKLANALVKEFQRYELQSELAKIGLTMTDTTQEYRNKVQEILGKLKTYLSESDTITEDDVTYMDEFNEHIKRLKTLGGELDYSRLDRVFKGIQQLVDRPITPAPTLAS